jgi:hypothetical protein
MDFRVFMFLRLLGSAAGFTYFPPICRGEPRQPESEYSPKKGNYPKQGHPAGRFPSNPFPGHIVHRAMMLPGNGKNPSKP